MIVIPPLAESRTCAIWLLEKKDQLVQFSQDALPANLIKSRIYRETVQCWPVLSQHIIDYRLLGVSRDFSRGCAQPTETAKIRAE